MVKWVSLDSVSIKLIQEERLNQFIGHFPHATINIWHRRMRFAPKTPYVLHCRLNMLPLFWPDIASREQCSKRCHARVQLLELLHWCLLLSGANFSNAPCRGC